MNRIRKTIGKILAALGTLAVCTAMLETGLRIAGRTPSNTIEGFFEQHGASYRLRKNMTKAIAWPSFSYVVCTDSFGFRDERVGDRLLKDRNYDVFIGSSATFGNGVDYGESFVGVYNVLSVRNDGVEALNLAVGGHRFRDQMQLFREFAGAVATRPRRVFICVDPNLLATIDTVDESILVKDGYLFDRDAWLLPYLKVTLANTSAAYCFLRDSIRGIQAGRGEGIDRMLRSFLDLYSTGLSLAACDRHLDEMTGFCREMGAEPVYVYLQLSVDYLLQDALQSGKYETDRYDLSRYARFMEEYCRARNLAYVDVSPALGNRVAGGGTLSFATDAHYNEQTSRIVGEFIYQHMQQSRGLKDERR
jgi:hypothetical protein